MPFWTYILHCRGGKHYTGYTDNLASRIAQHERGEIAGCTSECLPVELVWSQEFGSRAEAIEAERQINGWSTARKMALVRGDRSEISKMAPNKNSLGAAVRDKIEGRTNTPARLDRALADATGLSRERIKALIGSGDVLVDGIPATSPSAKLATGTPFQITLPPAIEAEAQPQDIPLDIAFEDADLIVINKPAGMVVHPAAGNPNGTLVNALLHHCKGALSGIGGVQRPGIVHRIDKDTSGLLVAAKTAAAHTGLAAQFADHSIHRRYLAVCAGHPDPPSGTIATRLGRSNHDRKKMAVLADDATRGKHAVTHYALQMRLHLASLIACTLETGRTHQVRVHCASIGHPLIGDRVYGRAPAQLRATLSETGFARQALHASELGFVHPVTGERVDLKADLPADMRELIDAITR